MPDLDDRTNLPLPDLSHLPLPASRQVIHTEAFRSRAEAVHRFNDKLGPLGWMASLDADPVLHRTPGQRDGLGADSHPRHPRLMAVRMAAHRSRTSTASN